MKDFLESVTLSVDEYVRMVRDLLTPLVVSVQGEVSGYAVRGQWTFFTLCDTETRAVLTCGMATSALRRSGVLLEDGMMVRVSGNGSLSQKTGSFLFWVTTLDPLGEGGLKKAYDALKEKFVREGLFTRKRTLPSCVRRVALITSRNGVVLEDVRANLAPRGFLVDVFHTEVEGSVSAHALVRALGAVERRVHDYEVVVLVRGGGSWESLQGFNDERVVRALFALPLPSVVGVGHEVDEPLCALVADVAVSTPTAVAEILNGTWEEVDRRASEVRGRVYSAYFSWREQGHDRFLRACQMVRMGIQTLSVKRDAVGVWCARAIMKSRTVAHAERQRMTQSVERMTLQFWKHHEQEKKREHFLTTLITKMGPEAVLARGYACVQYKGKVLTNTQHTPLGARLEVVQKDGILEVRVEGKKPRDYAKKES